MVLSDSEWDAILRRMGDHEAVIRGWEPAMPAPLASRCVQSRHRTLGHLRACQETWLGACLAFVERPNRTLTLLHPWRLYERESYDQTAWDAHLTVFLADRARWLELVASRDRQLGGRVNRHERTIETLTEILVSHEHHHLFTPR